MKPHNPYQVLEPYFDMFPPEKLFPLHSTTENLEKNTIVIYVSDHGDFNGEYGLIRKGLDLLTHVPMVMKGPDIVPQGRRGLCFVSLVDMSRTLCDMFGLGTPLGCQGKSFLPILKKVTFWSGHPKGYWYQEWSCEDMGVRKMKAIGSRGLE